MKEREWLDRKNRRWKKKRERRTEEKWFEERGIIKGGKGMDGKDGKGKEC